MKRKDDNRSAMRSLRKTLLFRLTEKGLFENEMHLFINDVFRIVQLLPCMDLEKVNNRLRLLGWNYDADYTTVQLILACNETKPN